MIINDKFFELPEDKRLRVVNAGFEVFSRSDYKHASTDDIAAKAGISKGLLFYYFHDKKSLYLFLYDTAEQLMKESVIDARFPEITDVFELFEHAAERKYAVLEKTPHLIDFVMRAYYSEKEPVSEELNRRMERITAEIYGSYFAHLDFSKFKDDCPPFEILQMLTWMADGYLHEKKRTGADIELDDLMDKYRKWSLLFKKLSYKEEFLA